MLKSYLSDRYVRVKQEDEYSELKQIKAGVPQGGVLGPVLYLLHASDLPQHGEADVTTFADDTAIMGVRDSVEEATEKLQRPVDKVSDWTRKWLIKLNEAKLVHVDFTNKRCHHIQTTINGKVIPHSNTMKYLGMTLDAKLRRKAHVKKKCVELGLKYNKMYWLMGRKSACRCTIIYAVQTNFEACVGLRDTAVGMQETEQH